MPTMLTRSPTATCLLLACVLVSIAVSTAQDCSNSTLGRRVHTGNKPKVKVFLDPCGTREAPSPSIGFIKRCKAFNYLGVKTACSDGRCFRQVRVGGKNGWIRNSDKVVDETAAASICTSSNPDGPPNCPNAAKTQDCFAGGVDVAFLAFGDWGRQGRPEQAAVAAAMATKAATDRTDFVISTGDNFYPAGLSSAQDVLFDQSFVNVYSQNSLQVPWHAVLGNHDYGDGSGNCATNQPPCTNSPNWQLGQVLAPRDGRWSAVRYDKMSLANGQVDLFFIDTNPIVAGYRATPWAKLQGGISEQKWQEQICKLKADLAASCAPWKIIIGHHPIRSNGAHGSTGELVTYIEPLITQYGVQAYFCGHEHSMEHLVSDAAKYHSIVTGAGSQTDRAFSGNAFGSKFQWISNGFTYVTIQDDVMTVEFITVPSNGVPAYTATINRQFA